jgi:cytoskeletal protein RodZ
VEEIGRRLKKAREARGIALEVAEEETKIRRKYIEALEAGQEAVLPGDAYLKGFLRTYGNYLGLDGTALVEAYKQEKEHHTAEGHGTAGHRPAHREPTHTPREPVHAARAPLPEAESPRPVREQAVAVREPSPARRESAAAPQPAIRREEVLARAERQANRPRRPLRKKENGALRTIGGAAIVLALVGAVCYLGWLIFSQGAPSPKAQEPATTPPPAASTQPEPATTTTTPPPLPEPAQVTMSKANNMDVIFAVPAKEITVELEIGKERVWYSAAVDGKTTSETVSTPATKVFKGSDIRIQVGHMEDVSLVVNGQRFDKPLTSGPYNLIFKGQ